MAEGGGTIDSVVRVRYLARRMLGSERFPRNQSG